MDRTNLPVAPGVVTRWWSSRGSGAPFDFGPGTQQRGRHVPSPPDHEERPHEASEPIELPGRWPGCRPDLPTVQVAGRPPGRRRGMGTTSRLRNVVSAYGELVVVLVAAALGLIVPAPLAWITSRQGINVLLVVLVFSTAVTIQPSALGRVRSSWRALAATLVVGATLLPALSWLVSRLVPTGSLRDGVMTVGLAPCEIASVATTALALGEAALSAGVLIGSTVVTLAVAGPLLALEAGRSSVHPVGIIVNLLSVVGLPLVAGLVVGGRRPLSARVGSAALRVATGAVAALVALVAAEVHLSREYLAVVAALAIFLLASVAVGIALGRTVAPAPAAATAVLLTTSMRDFAVAAALAATVFGAGAAAPLGLYGIMVLVWGTGAAGWLRRRPSIHPAG